MTPEREAAYRAKLSEALLAGYEVLRKDGAGLDAVVAAITILEDSPLFNAGKGAVFTSAGTNELDASIMDGRTLKAGAVAGVKRIKNPITLARLVMEQSPHVMMVGDGAEAFAKQQGGVTFVDPKYFFTEERWQQLERRREEEKKKKPLKTSALERDGLLLDEKKFGTVGAVCLDKAGNLSAGTSTGGMTYKRFGRVGDSPVIGAGTYADNQSCAVSCTGDGEYFIRSVVAHDIAARMLYGGKSLKEAAAGGGRKGRETGRRRRPRRHRPRGQFRHAFQHFRHVPRLHRPRRQAERADLQGISRGPRACARALGARGRGAGAGRGAVILNEAVAGRRHRIANSTDRSARP